MNQKILISSIIIINFPNLQPQIIFSRIRIMNPVKTLAMVLRTILKITLLSGVKFNHNLLHHNKIYWTTMMIMIKNLVIFLLITILMHRRHIIHIAPSLNNNLKFLFKQLEIIFQILIIMYQIILQEIQFLILLTITQLAAIIAIFLKIIILISLIALKRNRLI